MIASTWIPLSPGERALLDKVAIWPGWGWAELTPERIRALAAREGIDFATAVLYDRLRRSPEHGPFIADLEAMPDRLADDLHWNKTSFDRVLVAVAPGGPIASGLRRGQTVALLSSKRSGWAVGLSCCRCKVSPGCATTLGSFAIGCPGRRTDRSCWSL